MSTSEIEDRLTKKGVKPTANRILVLKALHDTPRPLGLMELEAQLHPLDKSSIFRVLTLFLEHQLVHAIEDGSGSLKYEMCAGDEACTIADMHIHFHCESCHGTYCLEQIPVPTVSLPAGFTPHSVNYVVKGECPACRARHQ